MSTRFHRRDVLALTTFSTLACWSPLAPRFLWETVAAAAEPAANDNVLVVVQLSGGNDGLNTVVPRDRDEYRQARPTLRPTPESVIKLTDQLGLHPALKGFARLWETQALTIVQGVGYPNPNRSHFESFDIWHTAQREKNARSTGWLGRYCDAQAATAASDPPAIHVGGEVQPLALAAHETAASTFRSLADLRLRGASVNQQRDTVLQHLEGAKPSDDELERFLRTTTLSALATSRRVENVASSARTATRYPGSELARRLQTVSQLIDAGLSTRIYYVVQDGYDTHSRQAAAHAALLTDLGDALHAFHADLGERGQDRRVTVMVFSEFGRRVRENASQGTDHGAAAPLFLVGGRVRSGIVGDHPSLTDLDDGDLKHHYDFRQVYATLLAQWLSCDPAAILGREYEQLPLVS